MDAHSQMMRDSQSVLAEVVESGGDASFEHPADPGRQPYPSIFMTAFFLYLLQRCCLELTTFPQCMFGSIARKLTTLAWSRRLTKLREFKVECCHGHHDPVVGIDRDNPTQFRTRILQSYPPEMCKLLAQAYVDAFKSRPPLRDIDVSEWSEMIQSATERPDLGTRVPVPEVGSNWDSADRWSEVARWRFKKEEHNNVLEGRAGVAACNLAARDPAILGHRLLMISDSQVVVGFMSKGRSSIKILNLLARRVASLSIGLAPRITWRYVRTHRNHADAPSRGGPMGTTSKECGMYCRISSARLMGDR